MKIDKTLNIEQLEPDKSYWCVNGLIFLDTEDIKEYYIESYTLLDDDITDFVTDEEINAEELSGWEIALKEIDDLNRMVSE